MTMTHSGNGSSPDQMITRAITDSVQVPPITTKDGIQSSGWGISTQRGTFLPAWGSRAREYALRDVYRMDEMGLITGSFTGITKTVASLGWEIKGDDATDSMYGDMAASQGWRLRKNTGVEYFQEVFRQANFGAGWGTFITQWMNDFLRYDAGGYVEVIAAGDAYDKPIGNVTGLAHLDPLRCYPTGDPRYPAVYYDRYGGLHVMHHSRVIRMVDMDDGDELHPGYGRSALSRAIAIAMQEVWISRYITSRLDDTPPPGLTLIGGITRQEWGKTDQQYIAEQSMDARTVWGKRKFYFTPDPSIMPKIESYEFSSPPEKFDWQVYTNINVDRLANAIGVDRQELMQLMGGNIGSGAQSIMLDQKARGKCIGYFLQEVERKLNDVLPDNFTFEWKQRDSQESMENAREALVWTDVAAKAGGSLSNNEKRTLIANEVPSIRDAINDTPRANDVDIQPVIAEDNTAGAVVAAPTPTTTDTPQVQPVAVAKEFITTQAMFVQEIANLLTSATTLNPYIRLDRRGFGITMRSILKRYGEMAYKDGMQQGGVSVSELDLEDKTEYMRVFMEQSQHVNGLADDVYVKKDITPANASSRAMLWGKSLQQFNDQGMMSANANGMYEWIIDTLNENCLTCSRMSGQVHRLKTYNARQIYPRSNNLACGGWRCGCYLIRTTLKARGRF